MTPSAGPLRASGPPGLRDRHALRHAHALAYCRAAAPLRRNGASRHRRGKRRGRHWKQRTVNQPFAFAFVHATFLLVAGHFDKTHLKDSRASLKAFFESTFFPSSVRSVKKKTCQRCALLPQYLFAAAGSPLAAAATAAASTRLASGSGAKPSTVAAEAACGATAVARASLATALA